MLNDIGPVIETAGLARIMGYAGKIPLPGNWDEATELVRSMNKRFFTNLTEEEWGELARQFFGEANGRPAPGYDPNLAKALSKSTFAENPDDVFLNSRLGNVPVLVLRARFGPPREDSGGMADRHPRLASVTFTPMAAPLLRPFHHRIIADFLPNRSGYAFVPRW